MLIRRRLIISLTAALALVGTSVPVSATFSIVARDPESGQLGAAVATRAFVVGDRVPWVKGGVGAVCSQATTNLSYGPQALKLIEQGKSPKEVVAELTSADRRPETRQLGIIDARGRTAGYTGSHCISWAGIISGPNFQVQGNTLSGEAVLTEMAAAFETARGELAARLLTALEAGIEAGGDRRGRQSAALLIAGDEPDRYGYVHYLYNLRVDDNPYPVKELRRLYRHSRAVSRLRPIRRRWRRSGDPAAAIGAVEKVAAVFPEQALVHYELACYLSLAGEMDRAVEALAACLSLHPTYKVGAGNNRELERRMPEVYQRLERGRDRARDRQDG